MNVPPPNSQDMPRIFELMASVKDVESPDSLFRNFFKSIADIAQKRAAFLQLESELESLDKISWNRLKSKVSPLLTAKDSLRGWTQAFDILNEAKGYNYLVASGCSNVQFIPESSVPTPDVCGLFDSKDVLCEVKTVNIFDAEANARSKLTPREIYKDLPQEFIVKLSNRIDAAKARIDGYVRKTDSRKVAYLVINFDDMLNEYVDEYGNQIAQYCLSRSKSDLEIVFDAKPPFYSNSDQRMASRQLVYTKDGEWVNFPR